MKQSRLQSNSKKAVQSYQQPKTGALFLVALFTLAAIGLLFIGIWLGKVTAVGPEPMGLIKTQAQIEHMLFENMQKAPAKQKEYYRELYRDYLRNKPATKNDIRRLETLMTSQTAPLQQINAVPRIRLLSQRFPDRGGSWPERIDNALKNTPLAGHGRDFALAAADAGIPPTLSVAIALHESEGGRKVPPGSHNPFGMTGPTSSDFWDVPGKGGDGVRMYQAYPDWATAIRYHPPFVVATWGRVKSPYEMRGYATSSAWANGVAAKMAQI